MQIPKRIDAMSAVEDAGRHIQRAFRKPVQSDTKRDGTLVTEIDHRINTELMEWAQTHKLPYIGEEGDDYHDSEYVVYVDPLDGTGAFARGIASVTVVLSIMKRGDATGLWYPVLSVIHDPIAHWTWSAELGKGAYLSKPGGGWKLTPLSKSTSHPIRATISTWPGVRFNLEHVARVCGKSDVNQQEFGGIALAGGLIASGCMDATVFAGTSAVETAAMSLLVNEVGGVTTTVFGESINGFTLTKVGKKYDFTLPHGAIVANNRKTAEILSDLVADAN